MWEKNILLISKEITLKYKKENWKQKKCIKSVVKLFKQNSEYKKATNAMLVMLTVKCWFSAIIMNYEHKVSNTL